MFSDLLRIDHNFPTLSQSVTDLHGTFGNIKANIISFSVFVSMPTQENILSCI